MIRVLRRADGNAINELPVMRDNGYNGLMKYDYITQQGNVGPNHASGSVDFEFANNDEFTSGFDGDEFSNASGGMLARMRANRERRRKMKEQKQMSKIRARDAKSKSKLMKADAKQTKAKAKETSAQAQKIASKELGKQDMTVNNMPMPSDAPVESGMSPTTKKVLIYGGIGLAVVGVGAFVYFKFIRKK